MATQPHQLNLSGKKGKKVSFSLFIFLTFCHLLNYLSSTQVAATKKCKAHYFHSVNGIVPDFLGLFKTIKVKKK